jgi:hypothetical protein
VCKRPPSSSSLVPGKKREKNENFSLSKHKPKKKNDLSSLNALSTFLPPLPLSPTMTVAGLNVVGPRVAAAVLLSSALYTLVPSLTHSEAPATTPRYAADGVYRARHRLQSSDRTGKRRRVNSSFVRVVVANGTRGGRARKREEGGARQRGAALHFSNDGGGTDEWFHFFSRFRKKALFLPFSARVSSSNCVHFSSSSLSCKKKKRKRAARGQNRTQRKAWH